LPNGRALLASNTGIKAILAEHKEYIKTNPTLSLPPKLPVTLTPEQKAAKEATRDRNKAAKAAAKTKPSSQGGTDDKDGPITQEEKDASTQEFLRAANYGPSGGIVEPGAWHMATEEETLAIVRPLPDGDLK
jgi:hypothetical protein